ncbi:MAG: xanthine dehydrogenase family protein molybdopterin-binding subunit [Betaproteobacteria bacterium]|nr:xanthine dehydrogenase family protein molybdopterin-binding subunit [Betaproteobacteria bacterium]
MLKPTLSSGALSGSLSGALMTETREPTGLHQGIWGSRRQFLFVGAAAGGCLLVGCSPIDPRQRGQAPAPGGAGEPSGPAQGAALNAWLRITSDGRVSVALPRSEMGQGVHTSLAMLVAEELDVPWAQVGVEPASPGRVYANTVLLHAVLPLQADDAGWLAQAARWTMSHTAMMLSLNVTGGSTSVRAAWEPMRWAGASAREVLRATAARHWKVDSEQCLTLQGEVLHQPSGRRMGYGELAGLWASKPMEPPSKLSLKPSSKWALIGTSPTRLDTPDKSCGRAAFGSDLTLPNLKRAVLRTCPFVHGRLVKVDSSKALKIAGVRAVHEFPDWPVPAVAVVADQTWQALKGAQALDLEWDPGLNAGHSTQAQQETMRQMLDEESGTRFRHLGEAPAMLAAAPQTLQADYEVPYLAHAMMEPLNATALFKDGRLQLWTGTQSPILARWRASKIADIDIDQVQLQIPYLGGGFGRRLETDIVEQATHLALKMPGTPVHLMWTREQDLQHDVYRPAALARLTAGLVKDSVDAGSTAGSTRSDRTGPEAKPTATPSGLQLRALQIKVVAPSLSDGTFRRLFPGPLTEALPAMPDKVQIEGAYDLPYAIANQLVEQVLCPSVLPVGSWRSVGHSYNAFFTECFLDEVAQALGRDPLALREDLLQQHPRHLAVLRAAAQAAGWGTAAPSGRARGLALHGCFGSICAQVAEVSLRDGRPRVHRIVCALDAGTLVHPDTVRAQLESAIVYGLSAALWGRVPVERGQVQLKGWADHPVLTMADMPQIDTVLIPSDRPPGGVGEPGTPPVAPAVVNALALLEGRRRRRLPLLGGRT